MVIRTWNTRAELEIRLLHSEQTNLYMVVTHDLRYNSNSEHQCFREHADAIKEGARRARLYYFYQ